MAAQVVGVFDENLRQNILQSKILVVGAGGIGCEILKNLVLSGFPTIEIIDLDTIDVSNLNRQFLFHKEHVGKSKAEVARKSALNFNPNVHIKAYHDSILKTDYGVGFFKRFNLVLNALDNRKARSHVNRLCLAAEVPLIESGTAGYNGQVELIKKGLTQCYDCTPKQAEKSYPGCTIRNTPSEPIHCIVWAKHLFNQLFGEVVEDEDVSPDTTDPENASNDAYLNETEAKDGNVERVNTRLWAQNTQYDPEKLFNKFFFEDIKYLISMSKLWEKRTPPEPVKWSDIINLEDKEKQADGTISDHKIWSISECANVFASSLTALKHELSKLSKDDHLVWDKDNKSAMDFVAACANIRAHIFKIALKTRFDIKSMAGNIIPAIATTNAITAGIAVMHAFKVLQNEFEKCKSVYMRLKLNPRNQLFVPDKVLNSPNEKCFVCSLKPSVTVRLDTHKMTLKQFRDDVLIKALSMVSPDATIVSEGRIVISSEDEDDLDQSSSETKLSDRKIVDGTILEVDDFFQNYNVEVIIVHKDLERDDLPFEIVSSSENLKPKDQPDDTNGKNGMEEENNEEIEDVKKLKIESKEKNCENDDGDDSDLCIIEDSNDVEFVSATTANSGTKRRTDPEEGPSTSKRAKMSLLEDNDDDDDDDDDDDNDLIILDD